MELLLLILLLLCYNSLMVTINSNITLLAVNTYSSVPSGDAASDVTGPVVILNDSLNDSIAVELVETENWRDYTHT